MRKKIFEAILLSKSQYRLRFTGFVLVAVLSILLTSCDVQMHYMVENHSTSDIKSAVDKMYLGAQLACSVRNYYLITGRPPSTHQFEFWDRQTNTSLLNIRVPDPKGREPVTAVVPGECTDLMDDGQFVTGDSIAADEYQKRYGH